MNAESFRQHAHQFVDWMADYLEQVENYPVKSQVRPKDIYHQIPEKAPMEGESMDQLFQDFQQIILPGITHWQSPNFFAYFPANNSYPSLLAEMLTATLGAQCMIWETSPAAAELEERMMNWLGQLIGIPDNWEGVIQATASEATLSAILSARERLSDFEVNRSGLMNQDRMRVYGSSQTHSSIEKAVKIAGLGKENFLGVAVNEDFSMSPSALREAIQSDLQAGIQPLCVVATLGTTSTTAIDPLQKIADICSEFGIWLHVDAAYAGSALALPEYRWMIEGLEQADSFVFNPHKWMLTHFDCSAYFVKDPDQLVRTFEILPEYLKTRADRVVNNYRDWGIPLGRRFRALKLWFVLRSYGVEGIQAFLREQIQITRNIKQQILDERSFEILAPVNLNLICFRYCPEGVEDLDELNARLLHRLNDSGAMYLTHTKLNGKYVLRLVFGAARLSRSHAQQAWNTIRETVYEMGIEF
ncbi:MAG: pyridoxal-dependent decarboxylase [Bacteroidota bacterium]